MKKDMTPGFHVRPSRYRLRKRWYVELVGLNHESLSTSELLNSEAAAHTNIAAQCVAAREPASTVPDEVE